MKCTGCGFDAPPDFAFCPKCGAKLASLCPGCGFAAAPDFAFCPKCGTGLGTAPGAPAAPAPAVVAEARPPPGRAARGAPAEESDRRTVTVLFADLCGFTGLSERLDPEEICALQDDMFAELTVAVERFDGFVDKFVGDALLALFGAPIAHEDDPERALGAALAMGECIAAVSERWQRRLGEPLALHIGINTGPVVAGGQGASGASAYSVTGDTVNTASRLQTTAEPGDILVGPVTHRLTRHAFAFDAFGELTLKGRARPLAAHRLLGALDTARPARGLEPLGLEAPLVGREDELGQMMAAFERTLGGQAQVVRLIGEAGAGKSRLLTEFLARLEAEGRLEGVAVRRVQCSSLGEQPYGVLASAVRDAYGVAPDDPLVVAQHKLISGLKGIGADEDDIARIAPSLGYLLGIDSGDLGLEHLDPEQLKRQIALALRTMVERRLQVGPLVWAVEDLHWADAASIEAMRFLVERVPDRAFMLIVVQRPDFDAGALATQRATQTAMRLARLTEDESEALLSALLGVPAARLPPHLRELIVARAGGNPFYIEEIVRGLIETGALVRDGAGWTCPPDTQAADIPLNIQGLLLARLDRMPRAARQLAQNAAILGSTFDAGMLRRIAGGGRPSMTASTCCATPKCSRKSRVRRAATSSSSDSRRRWCRRWSIRTCCSSGATSSTARSGGCSKSCTAASPSASRRSRRWATTSV